VDLRGDAVDDLADVLRRLEGEGYTADFFARDGALACAECDERIDPKTVQIDDVVRLEGESDPDEEVVVYAVSQGPCGRRGTFVAVYGPSADADDVAVEHVLRDARHR
jgi:hypothetical protein